MSTEKQNQYLDFLIDPSFQGVNTCSVVLFENKGNRKLHPGYYLPKVEIAAIKDYDIMIDDFFFLISQIKVMWEHMITFEKLHQVKEMITQLVVY